mgnify:CR=1 FL=1
MNEEVEVKKKKWPKEYHATAYELTLRQLRSCSPAKARKAGVLGWRKPTKEN